MTTFKNSNGVIFTTNEEAVINSLRNDPSFTELKQEKKQEVREEIKEETEEVKPNKKKKNK